MPLRDSDVIFSGDGHTEHGAAMTTIVRKHVDYALDGTHRPKKNVVHDQFAVNDTDVRFVGRQNLATLSGLGRLASYRNVGGDAKAAADMRLPPRVPRQVKTRDPEILKRTSCDAETFSTFWRDYYAKQLYMERPNCNLNTDDPGDYSHI